MNTPIQIAVRVVTKIHEEKCREDIENCYHNLELQYLWEQEVSMQKLIDQANKEYRQEVLDTLEKARRKLVNPDDIEPESYAEWINSIFNLAIKSVGDIK